MTSVSIHNGRRALNRAAVRWGYADIDTYLATGGGLAEAHERLITERDDIQAAMVALARIRFPAALAELESEQTGEPLAAIQGDEA